MKYRITIFVVLLLILNGCTSRLPDYYSFAGFAQGTTYSVIYDSGCKIEPAQMKEEIDTLLSLFDFSLSTYNKLSLISSLNMNREVIPDTLMTEVFARAREIWELTDGAFDITMGPLINAWGFGPDAERRFKPEMLDSLMQLVGMDKLFLSDSLVRKADQAMYIDVNAIAQGYSVDVICTYLQSCGVRRCLAEVGGEVRTVGSKYPDSSWRVSVDKPIDNNLVPGAEVQTIINLDNKSLATSGNYRKFYEVDGMKYSHTIDPKTGAPVRHKLLSATIVTDDCITADAFATACMVVGLEESKKMLAKYPYLEAYLVYSDENGEFRTWFTEDMISYISE